MSQVVIGFVGICTHIRKIVLTPPADALSTHDRTPGHFCRSVVVNASLGYRWGNQGIPPHDAVLYIPKVFVAGAPPAMPGLELLDPEAMTWKMNGVQIYVAHADPGIHALPSFEEVPSLTDEAEVLSLQLDPRVVLDGCASAVIDVFAGELDAFRNPFADDAVQAVLAVETADASRELVVTRMWDQQSSRIALQEAVIEGITFPPTVFIANMGRDADQSIDFFLHYLVTTWTPPKTQPPPVPGNNSAIRAATPQEQILLRNLPQGLTFGCSNSNYP